MKRFYSVLKLIGEDGGWCHVVTESENDEKEILRLAEQENKKVIPIVAFDDSGKGIFHSDFPH